MLLVGANYGRGSRNRKGDLPEILGEVGTFAGRFAMKNCDQIRVNPATLLNVILSLLPQHAEEGPLRESLPEVDLVAALVASGRVTEETGLSLVYTIRRQFEALSLLDPLTLRSGKWAFVSFPASLLGRSWLTTLATPGQALFSADYWEQGDSCPEDIKEEQRALLHRIEAERIRLNPAAEPVRIVHVAWGFIRWGDKFLLHRREDISRPGEKGYGFVGGRFKLSDLPLDTRSQAGILQETFKLDSTVVSNHISASLIREVKEETELLVEQHYAFAHFGQPLQTYKAVNGTGNRHAYSAYRIHLFEIKLTAMGETHLLAKVAGSAKLTWFSAAEIVAPQRGDGAAAYVDAMHQAWGESFEKKLTAIPDSRYSKPVYEGEAKQLDLPGGPNGVFQLGKSGKERVIPPARALSQEEWQLLMLLGWHTRGFHIELAANTGLRLLANGWLDAPSVVPLAQALLDKTQPVLPGLVVIREYRFVSLQVMAEDLFYAANLFHYQVQGSNSAGGVFRLKRSNLETPWGRLCDGNFARDINGNAVTTLRDLEKGDDPSSDHWDRALRDQLGEGIRAIGLRKLSSTKGNLPSLVEGLNRL